MNYFGLFFSFMVPGIVLGAMAAVILLERAGKRREKEQHRIAPSPQRREARKLYVHSIQQ